MEQLKAKAPKHGEGLGRFAPDEASGLVKTNFIFDLFDMKKPSAFFLLTVEDNIRLELDFIPSITPET